MPAAAYLIGIAGPSGAGKSYLANHLARELNGRVLATDAYYRDLAHLPLEERARSNFDDPVAIEHDLLIAAARQIRDGHSIDVPVYDFAAHTRRAETRRFNPTAVVIIEGLFALYWPELRDLIDTKVYVDLHDEGCLARRTRRDVRERGRTAESVLEQYNTTVAPMAERYVRPTAQFADVTVFGADPITGGVARVMAHYRQNSSATGEREASAVPTRR